MQHHVLRLQIAEMDTLDSVLGCMRGWLPEEIPPRPDPDSKCPKGGSSYRYEKRMCNTQDCTGDVICIATQDVVLGFDGSGSVCASNFEILKNYELALIQNYQMQYFGNGVIMPDGKTVSPAINAHKLTSDKDALKAARQSRASSSRKVSQTWPKHSPWPLAVVIVAALPEPCM